ncbi:hypothetical protein TVAG_360850 [Trichomonas vaginalis G3]|uniref:Rab-GAP TBC domain-containing protein n=1 Tax=Trichomonas vaginalis (strain ATCC PRA-98 / G3) TaxID=412133 RepID=A2FGP3_TRIV3|nr:hypothetical protein TVAGG3_0031760 [Trichomonas vaginalis G3]EAX95925.1 hypothetical protein TVAG_360850 [Trichomonas vaginalis G3]KAI5540145.1 hypothetical protein TVAGG3_0031760 [Trichomonas vaginalis G3]|eukprot:XP_001308855.1 hypothetical protein [Trichomonas vaginalis G3]
MNDQEQHFDEVFPSGVVMRSGLTDRIVNSNICNLGINSAIWKFLLYICGQSEDSVLTEENWINIVKEKRNLYQQYQEEFKEVPKESYQQIIEAAERDNERNRGELTTQEQLDMANMMIYMYFHKHNLTIDDYFQEFAIYAAELVYIYSKEMTTTPDPENPNGYQIIFDKNFIEADVYWSFEAELKVLAPLCDQRDNRNVINAFTDKIYQSVTDKASGVALERIKDLEMDVGSYFLKIWIRNLFGNIFENPEEVYTFIFASFPKTDFISNLAWICFHEGLFHPDVEKNIREILLKSKFDPLLLRRAFKKTMPNQYGNISKDLGAFLSSITESIETQYREVIVKNLKALNNAILSFSGLGKRN